MKHLVKNKSFYKQGEEEFGPITSVLYQWFSRFTLRSRYDLIARDVAEFKPKRILDVGAGPGLLDIRLAELLPSCFIYCVDPSEKMIDLARRNVARNGLSGRVKASMGSSRKISFEGKFDIILSSFSYHHWKDKEKSLDYLKKKLTRGGSIIIYDPFKEGLRGIYNLAGAHALTTDEISALKVKGMRKSMKRMEILIRVLLTKHGR